MRRLPKPCLAALVCLVFAPSPAAARSKALARAEAALVNLLCKGLARELQTRMKPGHQDKTPPHVLSRKVSRALGADPDLLDALDDDARRHRFAARVAVRAQSRCPAAMRGLQPPIILVEYLLEMRQKGGRAQVHVDTIRSKPELGKPYERQAIEVLRGHYNGLRRCYERALARLSAKERRSAMARAELAVSLSPKGRVSVVRLLRSTGKVPSVGACVMGVLKNLGFEPPEQRAVLEIGLVFHPPGAPAPVQTP